MHLCHGGFVREVSVERFKWLSKKDNHGSARSWNDTGHDIKLAGVCIPHAQSFGSGSWPKHGSYTWGFRGVNTRCAKRGKDFFFDHEGYVAHLARIWDVV